MNRRRVSLCILLVVMSALLPSSAHALLEGKFLYFPSHAPNTSALSEWRIDEQLVGYARLVEKPRAIWLILHGNAGQASHRGYIIERLPADASAYVLEYPGYGSRPGTPSMASINAAARAAYEHLRAKNPALSIGVFGESLGSGPASFLCSLPTPPDRLVLMVPYDNLLSVAKKQIRFLPVGALMRDKWDNVKTLSGYRGPVEIFGAAQDTVIPVVHARALAKSVPHARYVELPGGHNDWSSNDLTRISHEAPK